MFMQPHSVLYFTQAAKHILQGPTSALEGPGAHRGKQGNAAICGITTLTPNLIAYIATQVSYSLLQFSKFQLIIYHYYLSGTVCPQLDAHLDH